MKSGKLVDFFKRKKFGGVSNPISSRVNAIVYNTITMCYVMHSAYTETGATKTMNANQKAELKQ